MRHLLRRRHMSGGQHPGRTAECCRELRQGRSGEPVVGGTDCERARGDLRQAWFHDIAAYRLVALLDTVEDGQRVDGARRRSAVRPRSADRAGAGRQPRRRGESAPARAARDAGPHAGRRFRAFPGRRRVGGGDVAGRAGAGRHRSGRRAGRAGGGARSRPAVPADGHGGSRRAERRRFLAAVLGAPERLAPLSAARGRRPQLLHRHRGHRPAGPRIGARGAADRHDPRRPGRWLPYGRLCGPSSISTCAAARALGICCGGLHRATPRSST